MDDITYQIEEWEIGLEQQQKMRDESTTQQQAEMWSYYIINSQKELEKWHRVYSEVEAFLEYTR